VQAFASHSIDREKQSNKRQLSENNQQLPARAAHNCLKVGRSLTAQKSNAARERTSQIIEEWRPERRRNERVRFSDVELNLRVS
jgi:hypothetical protein